MSTKFRYNLPDIKYNFIIQMYPCQNHFQRQIWCLGFYFYFQLFLFYSYDINKFMYLYNSFGRSASLGRASNDEWMNASIISFMRIKLRFALLRSTLIAVRGERGKIMRREPHLPSINLDLEKHRQDPYEGWATNQRVSDEKRGKERETANSHQKKDMNCIIFIL